MRAFLARHKKKLVALAAAIVAFPIAHVVVDRATRILPPTVAIPRGAPALGPDGIARFAAGYTRVRAGVREVFLSGSPEEIGAEHATLLRDRMIADEGSIWRDFAHYVPISPARTLMMDVSKVRYRDVATGFPEPRRREIAAEALAFAPDPFEGEMPTFERMVFLHALYDIALSFEHSPLLGCSAFVLGPGATADGHTILARAFDFEAGPSFDLDKAVFVVKGEGTIPFASVAWPGLVGALSGMNAAGVAIVVNGARARDPRTSGEPVVFDLREVLEGAHDTEEAVAILKRQDVMVSHLVMVADAKGATAIVERAPGEPAFVRTGADPDRVPLTNHFEGPWKDDPKNLAVMAKTTTLARRARLDEMLAAVGPLSADARGAIAMLRDHACAKDFGGASCPIGDRRSIDAVIATHGIVADTTDRVLWVSAGPHLSGAFVRFDLKALLADGHDPSADPAPETVPADPILSDGRYEEARRRAGGPKLGGDGDGNAMGKAK